MPRIRTNGVELEYDEMGDGEPLVLIMGLGAQLVTWPDEMCRQLVARGFRVIRFDNRDAGRSTQLTHAGVPDMRSVFVRALLGLPIAAPYTLDDMADDVVGLLDALGVDAAHLVGASLGGMIAQHLAIRHPRRVRSLTSIMSSPGGRRFMVARPAAMRALAMPAPRTPAQAGERMVRVFKVIGSRGHAIDEARLREVGQVMYDRCPDFRGIARQYAAILASGSRRKALRGLRVPAVVIHGSDDPLILPRAARATARAIPGARLRIVEGMGHDMPRAVWPLIVDEVAGVAARARTARAWASLVPQSNTHQYASTSIANATTAKG